MCGGGFSRTDGIFLSQIGVWDDSIRRQLPITRLLSVFGAVFCKECWSGCSLLDNSVRTRSGPVSLAAGPAGKLADWLPDHLYATHTSVCTRPTWQRRLPSWRERRVGYLLDKKCVAQEALV